MGIPSAGYGFQPAYRFCSRELRNSNGSQLAIGQPEQFCTMLTGIASGHVIRVAPFPAAWRIEPAKEDNYRDKDFFR